MVSEPIGATNDMVQKKFGRLTVIDRAANDKYGNTMWICKCSCGNETVVLGNSLRRGLTTSCGCRNREIVTALNMQAVRSHNNSVELVDNTFLPGLTRKPGKNSTTGVKGVRYKVQAGKWQARIDFQGNRIFLGYFDSFDDAVKARKAAEEKYYEPVLNRHGRSLMEENNDT